ncbi:gas vesicle protein [Actinophytocola sp.]|uniref:gas vesicle protein GvpO n=1 Tax=Actinophytocola sp. TaxID=1872138 RepID=UPI003D6B4284
MAATDSKSQQDRDDGARSSAARIASHAREQIGALTAKSVEGVAAVEPVDNGWLVQVEVLEDQRIPSSSDMLALYEVEIDDDGDLLAYRRTKRYPRGRADLGTE